MFEDINLHKYLELIEIGETLEWHFRLVIAEAVTTDNPSPMLETFEKNDPVRKLLSESKSIEVTQYSKQYEIVFKDYISYSVTNESYATAGKDDVYEGRLARIYTKSAFLDYISNSTFASSDYPGPFKHYGFCCLNHIVDVASTGAPKIEIISA